ncbi:MAG: hypothetical protein PUB00_03280 [Clostridiales bacterium]|nr:hypothetical protein [Clostridiales bacterium]
MTASISNVIQTSSPSHLSGDVFCDVFRQRGHLFQDEPLLVYMRKIAGGCRNGETVKANTLAI